jgi:hypothetical protein
MSTPVGKVAFISVIKPVKPFVNLKKEKEGKELKPEFVVRMIFDGTTPEGLAFRNELKKINEGKVINPKMDENGKLNFPAGHFQVTFSSVFRPSVFNENGDSLEQGEIPFINTKEGNTEAKVLFVVGPEKPGVKYRYVRLSGVQLLKYEVFSKEEGGIKDLADLTDRINQQKKLLSK